MASDGSDTSVARTPDFATLYVERIRARNFRGFTDCDLLLEPDLTVLVGRNNSGKSRLLRALAIALGAVPAETDDLTVDGASEATIDIVLAPRGGDGAVDEFENRTGSRLADVQPTSDDPVRERFAWRTAVRPSSEGHGVRTESKLLTYDHAVEDWVLRSNAAGLNASQRSIVAADLVQTRRDLADELSRRGSPIRRVLDDLEVAPEVRAGIEQRLSALGTEILGSSKSLAAVSSALGTIARSIDEIGTPSVQPLPGRLEELARSVSINLASGGVDLPLRFHGSGARSLASLQVQSVLYDRRLGRDGFALLPHPVTLVEEPEAHLHPQAQFELAHLLLGIRGQVVVSTHSAHLASVVEPRAIRLLQRRPTGLRIVDLHPAASDDTAGHRSRRPSKHAESMEKLRRMVERPFGELLFASAIVIGDGATERALLPPLIRHALQGRGHGVCVVDPGSLNSDYAKAIVSFAKLVDVPWFLFCDSDGNGRKAGRELAAGDSSRVVWVPGDAPSGDKGDATERMLHDFDPALCEAACAPLGLQAGDDVFAFMTRTKGTLGALIAMALIARGSFPAKLADQDKHWPPAICELVRRLDAALPQKTGMETS